MVGGRVCQVCLLPLADGDAHRFDRECVNALRRRLERLAALYATAQRALQGGAP